MGSPSRGQIHSCRLVLKFASCEAVLDGAGIGRPGGAADEALLPIPAARHQAIS
jgi:hypothetical protein